MGYVASLAHPGGNVTGFMTYDPPIYTKQLQMLTQITPPARTVAVLYNPQTARRPHATGDGARGAIDGRDAARRTVPR